MRRPPNHRPTDKTRKMAESLSACGISHEEIANTLDISHDTLTRHYKKELKNGLTKANFAIAQSLYKKAQGGDTACMIFWLKTRARWRETGDEKPEVQTPTVIQFVRDNAH